MTWRGDTETFQQMVDRKRSNRMQRYDNLPKEVRELCQEYGFAVVDAFLSLGVSNPKHIRHLVELVLDEFSPTRGSKSQQGIRTEVVDHLKVPS